MSLRNKMIYAIQAIDLVGGGSRVSSEAYSTYEKAKEFCEKRRNAERKSDYIFSNENFQYRIIPLNVV